MSGRADPAEVRRRIAAWRRTGDLGRLWPEVSATARAAAHDRILRVTKAVLAEAPDPPPLTAPDEPAARALGAAAFLTGMGPLLGGWSEQGRIETDERTGPLFAEHLAQGRLRAGRLHGVLARILEAAADRDVQPVLLKGMHTGLTHFPEPGTRPAADLDLLVRPSERERMAEALGEAGFRESRRTRWAHRSEWVPVDRPTAVPSLDVERADDPFEVDLHVRLERWYFRGLRHDLGEAPFERTATVSVPPGVETRALAQPWLTIYLAMHAGEDPTRLRLLRIVELVRVIRGDVRDGRLDPEALADALARSGSARFVHPALSLAEGLRPGTVDPVLLADLERSASARMRRVIRALRAGHLAPLARPSLDSKLMWARGPREILMALGELIVPSDDGLPGGRFAAQTRRLRALLRGRGGWRAGPPPESLD